MTFDYNETFSRNIGWLTKAEQEMAMTAGKGAVVIEEISFK